MTIDIHTHCFPDRIAARAMDVLYKECGYPYYHDATVLGLALSTQAAGIDLSVILPIATRPEQTASINRWAIEAQGGPIASFGSIHPEYPQYRDEICRLKASGIRGIKLHPEYQNFFVDDNRYFPFYEAVFSAGLAILFHAGLDIGLKPPYHCLPGHLSRLLDAFPGAPVIAAHMGSYQCWDEVESLLIGRPIYLDTSFCIDELGIERSVRMMRAHGMEKILFGTDSPWKDQHEEVTRLRSLPLSAAETEAVLGGNASRLLGLSA